MTLRSKHLAALDSTVAGDSDVKLIFGDSTMQASLLGTARKNLAFFFKRLLNWFATSGSCQETWFRIYEGFDYVLSWPNAERAEFRTCYRLVGLQHELE